MLSSINEYQSEYPSSENIWRAPGLPSRGTSLFDLIRTGLPSKFFDRIAFLFQLRRKVIYKAYWYVRKNVRA